MEGVCSIVVFRIWLKLENDKKNMLLDMNRERTGGDQCTILDSRALNPCEI